MTIFEEDTEEYAEGMAKYYESAHGSVPSQFEKYLRKAVEYGYNKANEWHNLKTEKPPLRKEVLWCIDNQLWLGQLCESWIDFGEWDIDSVLFNDYEIAWKEIVLPELPKESE